ncbi:MAG: hypothetical protein M1820_009979 [Bogoriella megaspora]|nr:MAG: hypothetical protein M1820_009979 [Bogoriella megaspora]
MPIRSDWKLQREGITADTLARLFKRTVFNPVLTLPLVLLARYSQQGRHLAAYNNKYHKWLKVACYLGLFQGVSDVLDRLVANNWTSDDYEWDEEIVVITGGSDGIGKIVTQLLAERGIRVCVLDVQPLTYEAPPTVHFHPCDITSPTAIQTAASSIQSTHGHPTILILNAGISRGKEILSLTPADLNTTFAVNTLSHYYLVQAFLPSLIKNNHGMVVTVASTAAYLTAPQMVDYAASKAAALAFHEGLSAELVTRYKAPKVRTVAVCQGYTKTSLFTGFGVRRGFLSYPLEPRTVAEEIVKQVLSGKSGHVFLPEQMAKLLCVPVRGWPPFMQLGFRKGLDGLMKSWTGRQVIQPSEAEEGVDKEE